MVYSRGIREIRQTESDLERARERIEQMKIHTREKDVTIRKITEVQRLTNNHVTNLEIIIGDLRRENQELGKTLVYLNRHEALIFKAKRKLGEQVHRKYPPGSLERKQLKYKKDLDEADEIGLQLKLCADSIEELDYQMQEIRDKIDRSRA